MGATRRLVNSPGFWEVDAVTDLANVNKVHGTEAYVKNDSTWVKYNIYTSTWNIMGVQEAVDTTGVVPISPN